MLRKLGENISRLVYNLSTVGLSKGPHITRYVMYRELAKHAAERPVDHRVPSISHSDTLCCLLGYRTQQLTSVAYPDVSMLDLPFEDGSFDAVFSDQVLEHVNGSPFKAVGECFRVVKPGGFICHTTCFINPVHGAPSDYWRFTPEALELLVEGQGEVLAVGGWGNPYVWGFVGIGLRSRRIPHTRWHPAHWIAAYNDKRWPIVSWILARKSEISTKYKGGHSTQRPKTLLSR